jgi:hypothetical protein
MKLLQAELASLQDHYDVCGLVTRNGLLYPLGADTKVLSTVFELIVRPVVYRVAATLGVTVAEPAVQNHYPDFTLMRTPQDNRKIAIDVKTTYRSANGRFGYTLGGYTSFIRPGRESKNIVFPFNQYASHCVIGFVYDRLEKKKASVTHTYDLKRLLEVPLPFDNVDVFVQEKWRIASDRAGSGNTTNIGSIEGTLEDFIAGKGPFVSEAEFLEYWRGYERTSALRAVAYSKIEQFRKLKKA